MDPNAGPEGLVAAGEDGFGALVGDQMRMLLGRRAGEADQLWTGGIDTGLIEQRGSGGPFSAVPQ